MGVLPSTSKMQQLLLTCLHCFYCASVLKITWVERAKSVNVKLTLERILEPLGWSCFKITSIQSSTMTWIAMIHKSFPETTNRAFKPHETPATVSKIQNNYCKCYWIPNATIIGHGKFLITDWKAGEPAKQAPDVDIRVKVPAIWYSSVLKESDPTLLGTAIPTEPARSVAQNKNPMKVDMNPMPPRAFRFDTKSLPRQGEEDSDIRWKVRQMALNS